METQQSAMFCMADEKTYSHITGCLFLIALILFIISHPESNLLVKVMEPGLIMDDDVLAVDHGKSYKCKEGKGLSECYTNTVFCRAY